MPLKGLLIPPKAHLFARAYAPLERGDYHEIRKTIREDMERGYSRSQGIHVPGLVYETDIFGSKSQRLPGLCAMCGARSYKELARRIWLDLLRPSGWLHSIDRIAIFEGMHVGYDGARFPLFKPTRLLAIVESVHGIAESQFARRHPSRLFSIGFV